MLYWITVDLYVIIVHLDRTICLNVNELSLSIGSQVTYLCLNCCTALLWRQGIRQKAQLNGRSFRRRTQPDTIHLIRTLLKDNQSIQFLYKWRQWCRLTFQGPVMLLYVSGMVILAVLSALLADVSRSECRWKVGRPPELGQHQGENSIGDVGWFTFRRQCLNLVDG